VESAVTAVVGLDLSLTATGIATPYGGVSTVTSKGHAGASLPVRHVRLRAVSTHVMRKITDGTSPTEDTLIVVEAPAFDSRTGHQHDRSGLWWMVVDDLLAWGHSVVEVTTGGLKKYATGRGNAGKDEVLAAVIRRYPDVEVSNNNEADALVLRAMGCDWLGEPLAEVPKANRAALDKVVWPEAVTA
jgi:crossover junction endodeoxyribonuclease RuvC